MRTVNIKSIDSITIVVTDIARAIRFYHEVFDLPMVNGSKTTLQVGGSNNFNSSPLTRQGSTVMERRATANWPSPLKIRWPRPSPT
ncbi:VOC family protein [Secundilactobacillus kimchicus]|uniref:VOC family protein n=1 Tax=Secundilactobacillus kimchicus TaxID=528209 RepID=UPI0031F5FEAF